MSELEEIRERINLIDRQMASLFEERMEECRQVANYKKVHSLQVEDSSREAEILAGCAGRVTNKELVSYYTVFQKELMRLSKEYQNEIVNGATSGPAIQ